MADPVLSRIKAEELLRADPLPAGYKAGLSVSVPMLGRVALLEQRSGVGELFLYLESSGPRPPVETEDPRFRQLLGVRGLRLEPGVAVAEAALEIGALRANLRTIRGRLHQPLAGERDVLLALIDIECRPPQKIARLGVWIGTDPAPGSPLATLDLSGTPADPEAVRAFLSAFRVCD